MPRCAVSGFISTKQSQIVHNDIPDACSLGDNTIFMGDQRPVLSGGVVAVNFALQGALAGATRPSPGSANFLVQEPSFTVYSFPPAAPTHGSALQVPKDGLYSVEWTVALSPIVGSLNSARPDDAAGFQDVMVGAVHRGMRCDTAWQPVPGAVRAATIGLRNRVAAEPSPTSYMLSGVGLVDLRAGALVALQNLSYDSNDDNVRQDIALSPGKYISRDAPLPDLATLRVTRVGAPSSGCPPCNAAD